MPPDTPRTRRVFLRDAGLATAIALETVAPRIAVARSTRPARRATVAVLGGGVAGLTAAHELAERGFDVALFERRALGGKARSIPVPRTGRDGRRPLPAEHGFRAVFGPYHHLPDTMRRIPDPVTGRSVYDNLVPAGDSVLARPGGREDFTFITAIPVAGVPDPLTVDSLYRQALAAGQLYTDIPPQELAFAARQIAIYMTSSDERRLGQWEHQSWWDYFRADNKSADYKRLVQGYCSIQAVQAKEASARSFMNAAEIAAYCAIGRGTEGPFDRVLNAPTNEAWIDPWITRLRELGVHLRVGHTVETLEVKRGRIAGASVRDRRGARHVVKADWFVCALPMERARRLWTSTILTADPQLERMSALRAGWETGIQFYLRSETPINHGHIGYETPWQLFSISQAQFWKRDFPREYGDGQVRDCLSVIISNWNEPGILYGKPARDCTPDQIAREVWAQIRSCLEDTGKTVLPDEILHSFFLDPAIGYHPRGSGQAHNDDPLFSNTVSSWDNRPRTTTAIPNLLLAGDYVQTDFDVATMEAACESGRAVANALLQASRVGAEPARMFHRYSAPELAEAKSVDAARYRRGQPHILDTPWPPT
jgi:uncharacterized protein with NAD-binding domain and iron-sulfur cluster